MATGVKPRDEEHEFTRTDLEAIQDAMKSKKFRDMLTEYCDEVRDPANQALYQKEMTQLEKERGYDVTFINPKGGYVIKTSVAGDRKAFINICSNDNIAKPSCEVQVVNGQKGMNWQIPYSLIPPREDFDYKRERCVIYDVVFNPDTLRMAEVNKQFRDLVNKTALEGLQKTYNIHLDGNNFKFPKSSYKGMTTPAVIRTHDPNYKPQNEDDADELSPEIIEKLYPQHSYSEKKPDLNEDNLIKPQKEKKFNKKNCDFVHSSNNGYTVPKYTIKQQKNIDFQDFTYHKDSKQYSAIPSHIVVEINLPLLSSTKDCILDVQASSLSLKSEKPAKYKLDINLPYSVNDECGNAKFDKSKRKLIVTLPVIKKTPSGIAPSLKADSGVESEENSGSQSDEDVIPSNGIIELPSEKVESLSEPMEKLEVKSSEMEFLDPTLGYTLPPYTQNVLDDIVAFTFHVKNTDPDSVEVKKHKNNIYMKFTSVGSGFVPVHYAAIIKFDEDVNFDNATGEAWDNNVILQLELASVIPQKFHIGLSDESMVCELFGISQCKKPVKSEYDRTLQQVEQEEALPNVEVTNLGTETNIVVSSNYVDEEDEDDLDSPTSSEKEIIWRNIECNTSAKSILRKSMPIMRSYSESSAGDIASSMDYISSDCILEESSLKKTVRFSDVIARQFYRYNSSIEGQKKKNQRKKSKKRSQERRKSESEAEDDTSLSKPTKVLKQRRDSGLADTSDAEGECKNSSPDSERCYNSDSNDNNTEEVDSVDSDSVFNIVDSKRKASEPVVWKSETSLSKIESSKSEKLKPITCDNIKHNTDFYNPNKLNKGQYTEVMFKNDLIFDLDM